MKRTKNSDVMLTARPSPCTPNKKIILVFQLIDSLYFILFRGNGVRKKVLLFSVGSKKSIEHRWKTWKANGWDGKASTWFCAFLVVYLAGFRSIQFSVSSSFSIMNDISYLVTSLHLDWLSQRERERERATIYILTSIFIWFSSCWVCDISHLDDFHSDFYSFRDFPDFKKRGVDWNAVIVTIMSDVSSWKWTWRNLEEPRNRNTLAFVSLSRVFFFIIQPLERSGENTNK